MEMQTFKTTTVLTYDSLRGNLKVCVPVVKSGIVTSCLLKAVSECLGLKPCSQKLFALFDHHVNPRRRYLDNDLIPLDTTVSLQKWCFDAQEELQAMTADAVASKLIFQQSQAAIQAGFVTIDKEVEAKLEEFADEHFTIETEYVKTCHSLEGFPVYRFSNCVLCQPIDIHSVQFVKGNSVCVNLTLTGIQLVAVEELSVIGRGVSLSTGNIFKKTEPREEYLGTQNLFFHWWDVKSWQLHEQSYTVSLTVRTGPEESQLGIVPMTTDRCSFLIDVTNACINQILKCNPSGPKFYTSMVSMAGDGSKTWQNAMFDHKLVAKVTHS